MLMALTILGEAENQPFAGKVGVGKTIVNRMKKAGKGVAEIALAPWQYSCWNPGDPRRVFLIECIAKQCGNVLPGVWDACVQAAEMAMDDASPDPTCGSTHYTVAVLWGHDDSKRKKPRWFSMQAIADGVTEELARIGDHVFGRSK